MAIRLTEEDIERLARELAEESMRDGESEDAQNSRNVKGGKQCTQ